MVQHVRCEVRAIMFWSSAKLSGMVAILMIFNGLLLGQSTFASLRGTIRDPAGSAIAAAVVTARNSWTRASREVRTDPDGTYTIFNLLPSTYEITIAAPGFATIRRTNLELAVSAEVVLDFTLDPPPVQSSIEVHA